MGLDSLLSGGSLLSGKGRGLVLLRSTRGTDMLTLLSGGGGSLLSEVCGILALSGPCSLYRL